MKKVLILAIVLLIVCIGLSSVQRAYADYEVPTMFRGNPMRTGRVEVEGPKSSGLKWEHRIDTRITSSPIFDNKGIVYFASYDGIVVGLSPEKGTTAFSLSLGENINSTPVIYNNRIFIAGGNPPHLYSFSLTSATRKWRIYKHGDFHSSSLIANDTLYIGCDDGYMFAKDLTNDRNEFKWEYNVGSPVYSSPAYSGSKIFFGADNGYLYCLTDTGQLLWKTTLGGKIRATPLISGSYLYVGSSNGNFCKMTLGGDVVKTFKTGGDIYSSAALMSDGSIVVGSYDGYVYIFSDELTLLYKFNAGGQIYSSPCVAVDDTIYVGTLDGILYAITNEGEKLFDFEARAPIYSSPSIGMDGTLYFGDDKGWIYAIGSQTGIITVFTNLDEAEYLIEGPRTYYGKGKSYKMMNAQVGEYTITYKDVSGYNTPESVTLELKANSSIHFEGAYEKAAPILSAIVIITNLDDATFTVTGPAEYTGSGKSFTIKNVPAGIYTVKFNDVTGYKTPESIEKEVKEGDIVTFTGIYEKLPEVKKTEIVLQIDNAYMMVNGVMEEVDPSRGTAPTIIAEWGRTVLPLRAIVETLGGEISWDGNERKVTILFKDTIINLWIGKNTAQVNDEYFLIDSKNPDVSPVIINSRTMVPIRFVAETLGCTVEWDPDTRTVTITYTESAG